MKYLAPASEDLSSLLPEIPVLLMGSGPVPVPHEVAKANTIVISHLGDTMKKVVSRVQLMAQYVFQTKTSKIFGISGPSSAGMEMAVSSLLWPGRKVLVLNLGTFSARFAEMARGLGAEVKEIFPKGMAPIYVDQVKDILEKESFDVLTIVQGETSCGVKNIYLKEIVGLAKKFGLLTIVDAVCTLSTMPLPMDEWEIDVVFVGGQKGLSAVPGISLIAFSESTFDFVSARTQPMPHWCLDPRRAHKFWGLGEYHYTAPVTGILALHEGLRLICEETLERRFERHLKCSTTLQRSLEAMGLTLFTPEEFRLNSVVAINNLPNVKTKELISLLIKECHLEISGAFGLDIIRVGQMGEQCRYENIQRVLVGLAHGYSKFGHQLDLASGLKVFNKFRSEE